MRSFPPRQDRGPARWSFARWCRQWSALQVGELLEMARLGTGEVAYLTQHMGTSAADDHAVSRGDVEADLLRRRMMALGLDPYEWARSEPALLRHLSRCCSQCPTPERCALDLEAEANGAVRCGQNWRTYCPNVATLDALSAVQQRSQVTPKYVFPYLGWS